MSSFLPPMRSANLLAATASVPLAKPDRQAVVLRPQGPTDAVSQPRRSKIWELAETLHCSIIGTCLSTAELRHVLVRLNATGAQTADEHELHVLGVMLAGRREAGAKFLQKALDRSHGLSIKQYASAKDEKALRRLWTESVRNGDIPGAYWALLSHPAATQAVMKRAFQDVHMLSHLVGAANRADIRKLRQLEEDSAALTEKMRRQQLLLRDGFKSRDERIRQLSEMLIGQVEQPSAKSATSLESREEAETLRNVIKDTSRKLGQEKARREHLERRLDELSTDLKRFEVALRMAEGERDVFRRDLDLIENHVIRLLEPPTDDSEGTLDLLGRTILYVGGRTHQIPQLKALVERTKAHFLHHDGGMEHNSSLLPGLISRADIIYFPIDCISHDAVVTIKRLCRKLEKPFRALRSASLAALMSSLATIFQGQNMAIAAE